MGENYSLLSGQKTGGMFFKAVGVGSLLTLIAAVIIGIYISTQVHKIAKTTPGPTFANWKVQFAAVTAFRGMIYILWVKRMTLTLVAAGNPGTM